MYGICTLRTFYFFSKNRLTKILFSNPFPKKRSDCESQKSRFGFDPKSVDFMDSWSVFGFAQKKAKFIFGFGNPDLDFPKKKRTLKVNLLLTSYWRVLWRKCLCFCSLCFFTDAHFHIGIAASISHFLTAAT